MAAEKTAQPAAARSSARFFLKRVVIGALLFCVTLYAGICLYMFTVQRQLQYRPDIARIAPAATGLSTAEEITLRTPDGETLVSWWVAPQHASQPVYLYFHGNGGNLARRTARFQRLIQNGAGLMALSWRGYGGSTGSPSEDGFHADARAAYAWLAQHLAPTRIIAIGESIGTGVAVKLASEQPMRALALDSPYSSTADVARDRYPWLPIGWLMRDQFRADLSAPQVKIPVLIGHCRDDRTIPLIFSQRLAVLFP
ncbi:MAG: alpha/beta hydrolase, partial [Beijerinckiaceae bacterium]